MIVIETERLLFRDHVEADLEAFCQMESDPEYRWPQKVHPRVQHSRKLRSNSVVPKPMALLATVFKPDGRYIGRCGLYPNRGEDGKVIVGEAQLAFYLARPYWGRGLATEAGRAFIQRGFGILGVSRIEAGANASNAASNQVLKKLGFKIRSGQGGGSFWHDYELRNHVG